MAVKMNFQSKANRDKSASAYKAQGYTVRKRSMRNQILSPDYVADYSGTPSPNGFGGSQPEAFSAIYNLEVVR